MRVNFCLVCCCAPGGHGLQAAGSLAIGHPATGEQEHASLVRGMCSQSILAASLQPTR